MNEHNFTKFHFSELLCNKCKNQYLDEANAFFMAKVLSQNNLMMHFLILTFFGSIQKNSTLKNIHPQGILYFNHNFFWSKHC